MTRPRKALISPDTPYYHITSRCVPKALRGAGSTQSTSWGRLYVAHSCAVMITIPAKATNTGDNGWWAGFGCCHRYSPSMFAPTP